MSASRFHRSTFEQFQAWSLKHLPAFVSRSLKTRKENLRYLRSISSSRLIVLSSAACLLFGAIGLLTETASSQPVRHLADGFIMAVFIGVIGAAYSVSVARKPLLIFGIVALQVAGSSALARFGSSLTAHTPLISFEAAAKAYVPLAITLITLSYVLFLWFIQTEGRYAFRAQTELALAHSIQETLVPILDLVAGGCAIYGISVPSEKVGGDLVDAVSLPDGTAFAYLADIAGHGLQAGILMGRVKTAFRTCTEDLPALGRLFDKLNAVLPSVKEAHMYATCAALRLRPQPGVGCIIEYALAGHPPMLHLSASGTAHAHLSDEQLPLGLVSFTGYASHQVQARSGDLIVAATDGIVEVCDSGGDELGTGGLEALARGNISLPLPKLAETILAATRSRGLQDDDQTLLLIRVL